ncbi:uncharacterized protein LOC132029376 [Lycium ferocissimum]|uniref:uncharacterized protein LOC132029376 n=1 Tax=Lycium ferocissimum TaxID=112874 RepID=UPI0028161EC2|nr:uncharacterized protein LOC132029376 [Lycium ferocissimum]
MPNSLLNKLCMDEEDAMVNGEVRCKHGILLKMQTSWSDRNPGRRFWSCPHYEATNCKFFKWRYMQSVDERSKFIIPRLVNKIKELEENYGCVSLHLAKLESFKMQYDNLNMNSLELEDLKKDEMQLDELESLTLQYDNLNINSVELEDSKERGDLNEVEVSKEEKNDLNELGDSKEKSNLKENDMNGKKKKLV